jgi:hypothetical protein
MLKRVLACQLLVLSIAAVASADVSMVEHQALRKNLRTPKPPKVKHGHPVKATGSQGLIDASGLKYFINTNITFSTTSSASGAMSEASYTHAVAATTSGGGTTSSTLNDAFDGYNTICLSLNNTVANCQTGNANFVIYNRNNAPATTECRGAISGVDRQVVLPVQTSGSINIQRKVFVPDNDSFGRWLNYFTNTGATAQTVTVVQSNNLGSDNNTKIVTSSNGDNVADVTDTWVTSFQNYSGNTSSDVRLGHVFQGAGAAVPLAGIHFVDGDDNPYWGYTFTLAPGQTTIIADFVVGQPSNAASATKAAEVSGLPDNALQCLTDPERVEIANFQAALPIVQVPALGGLGLFVLAAGLALAAVTVLAKRRSVRA